MISSRASQTRLVEQAGQTAKFGLGEALPELAVEADGGIRQAEEQGVAVLAELDDVDPPVARVPPPGQQPVCSMALRWWVRVASRTPTARASPEARPATLATRVR